MPATSNLRIKSLEPLIPPARLSALLPLDDASTATIVGGRRSIERLLAGEDPRLLAVVGPCSIHDLDVARDYAGRLLELSNRVSDRLLVVMRVYFEKPRTTVGWKGLINDPHIDDSFDVGTGLRLARGLLIEIARMGLATATEFLEPITPQYIADTIVLGAIGARTTESPTHRQMASGLSMPVASRTRPTARCRRPSTRCSRPAPRTASSASTTRGGPASSRRPATPGVCSCFAAAAADRTIPPACSTRPARDWRRRGCRHG